MSCVFPDGATWCGDILENSSPWRFAMRYRGGSGATFLLGQDDAAGRDLRLTDRDVPQEDRAVVLVGWVAVLLALKAVAVFGVDLCTHDPRRTWAEGQVENEGPRVRHEGAW